MKAADLIRPSLSIEDRIAALIDVELCEFRIDTDTDLALLDAFTAARIKPRRTTVNFSGGVTKTCWTVTRTDGDYRVVYIPIVGYFSLCVESALGPLDVGVHGSALGCFGSV